MIEQKSAKGADVLSVSSDSAEDVHPHQQSGSQDYSPQCIGPLFWKVEITFLVKNHNLVMVRKCSSTWKLTGNFFRCTCRMFWIVSFAEEIAWYCCVPCQVFASSIALLSDEVELRPHGKCFCFIAAPNREWKCRHRGVHSHMFVPSLASVRFSRGVGRRARVFLASSTWTVRSRHSKRFSIKTLLWTHVVSRFGLVVGWRPLTTQDHALCSQLCTTHVVSSEFSTTSCLAHQVRTVKRTRPRNKQVSCPRPIEIGLGKRSQNERSRASASDNVHVQRGTTHAVAFSRFLETGGYLFNAFAEAGSPSGRWDRSNFIDYSRLLDAAYGGPARWETMEHRKEKVPKSNKDEADLSGKHAPTQITFMNVQICMLQQVVVLAKWWERRDSCCLSGRLVNRETTASPNSVVALLCRSSKNFHSGL